jgi:hypothetical protein
MDSRTSSGTISGEKVTELKKYGIENKPGKGYRIPLSERPA